MFEAELTRHSWSGCAIYGQSTITDSRWKERRLVIDLRAYWDDLILKYGGNATSIKYITPMTMAEFVQRQRFFGFRLLPGQTCLQVDDGVMPHYWCFVDLFELESSAFLLNASRLLNNDELPCYKEWIDDFIYEGIDPLQSSQLLARVNIEWLKCNSVDDQGMAYDSRFPFGTSPSHIYQHLVRDIKDDIATVLAT